MSRLSCLHRRKSETTASILCSIIVGHVRFVNSNCSICVSFVVRVVVKPTEEMVDPKMSNLLALVSNYIYVRNSIYLQRYLTNEVVQEIRNVFGLSPKAFSEHAFCAFNMDSPGSGTTFEDFHQSKEHSCDKIVVTRVFI